METVNNKRPFGMRDKLSYAAGDLGCNMSFALKSTIMAIFWTQFMALGETLYATLLLVVQIWDAINDPLLGSLFDMDKRKYKHGKFKTYIFIGAIGLLFSGLFFFLPIPGAPKVLRCTMFVLGYVLWDAFYTVASVPYGSMLSLLLALTMVLSLVACGSDDEPVADATDAPAAAPGYSVTVVDHGAFAHSLLRRKQ